MIVLMLEKVPVSLRGELTRWLLELRAGVFVGRVSGMVRDRLWEKACDSAGSGAALMVQVTDNEQGFQFRYWGATSREVVDFDGLSLIRIPA